MNITTAGRARELASDYGVIVPYAAAADIDALAGNLGLEVAGLTEARTRRELKGALYKTTGFRSSPAVMFVGLGAAGDFSDVRWKRAVEAGARALVGSGYTKIAVYLGEGQARLAPAGVEAVMRSTYGPGIHKTSDTERLAVESLVVVGGGSLESGLLDQAKVVTDSINLARDLLNRPPSELNPSVYADRVREIGQEAGFSVRIYDEAEINGMGMGAIMGVSSGSDQPPRVMDLEYGDPNAAVKLALVGKGLTYDSGGLSLKTHEGLEWMKGDMGGSAAVVGAMRALAMLKPTGIYVRGIIGAVENMTGGSAMKPGDVLKTMNGKTIEVLNTDAEGRLVLADLLSYAVKNGATHIVDLATLTGAAEIALGNEAAALVGRPQSWIDLVKAAAEGAFERVWQLPLYPEYRRRMNSEVADMKNTGGRPGGALTASSVLAEFVGDVPWAHLDIAGVAWVASGEYSATGGTGFGVALLVRLAMEMAA